MASRVRTDELRRYPDPAPDGLGCRFLVLHLAAIMAGQAGSGCLSGGAGGRKCLRRPTSFDKLRTCLAGPEPTPAGGLDDEDITRLHLGLVAAAELDELPGGALDAVAAGRARRAAGRAARRDLAVT